MAACSLLPCVAGSLGRAGPRHRGTARPTSRPGASPAARSSSFANSLQLKDPDIQYPAADAMLGFVADKLPEGIPGGPVTPTSPDRNAVRRLVLERDAATIRVTIHDRGEASFETYLGELLATDGDVEQVSVLGHPAVLVEHPNDGRWSLVWRQIAPTSGGRRRSPSGSPRPVLQG
jgi:hypothetical protein